MPTNYATKQAANKLQVSPNTLRNWSDQYADYLSESARPGYQPERRFTEKDLTILGYIKQLRTEGMKEDGIKARLTETSFTDIEVLAPTIQQPPEGSNAIAQRDAQESPSNAPAPIVTPDYLLMIERRLEAITALEAQMHALQQARQEDTQQQRSTAWWWVAGLVCGLGLAAVAELFALLTSRLR